MPAGDPPPTAVLDESRERVWVQQVALDLVRQRVCEQAEVFVFGQEHATLGVGECEDELVVCTGTDLDDRGLATARRAVTTAKSQLSSATNRAGYSRPRSSRWR